MCRCEQTQKTAAHVIAHCQLYAEIKKKLCRSDRQMNIRVLVNSVKKAQHLAQLIIKLCILLQFNLAEELLYEYEKKVI